MLGRNPNVNRTEYLHLKDGAIRLAPFVELEPCRLGRNIVDAADEGDACDFRSATAELSTLMTILQVWRVPSKEQK